jgi:aminopeptidase
MSQPYTPNDAILQKYARLLVRFGLQNREGKALAKGSVVLFEVPDVAKPLYFHLQNEILAAGYHPLGKLLPTDSEQYNLSEAFYTRAKKPQREFFPEAYVRGMMQQIDGRIAVLAKTHPNPLANVDPKLLMQAAQAKKLGKELFFEKVDAGKLSWTLGFYGTAQAAADAGMSERAYWNQIIKACYLDHEDPVAEWKKINRTVQKTAQKLSAMEIDQVHILGPDMDLTIGIGADRAWRAGGGNNVPSYEVFTSPDYRRVNGWIRFNQPLYDRYGNLITDIRLEFRDGECIRSSATKNEAALKQLLKTPGGSRLGEFSLTDARLSRITKFMANTLYDENVGGKYGNTHVAIGSAYRDCYQGQDRPQTDKAWDALGYNDSVVHEDIVSTTKRTVTATLSDGQEKVIYQDGHFQV